MPSLSSLRASTLGSFRQLTFRDEVTGKTLPYNLYLPDGYDGSTSYPVVLFIADSGVVGRETTAPLQGYGGLIWASRAEQAKHPSLVVVPEFPSVTIDDHNGFTMTGYVEMTRRLLTFVESRYRVDPKRVYATGQSMGCMMLLYLAAAHPGLFTAEYFVSGQWDIRTLAGLRTQKFFYLAAGGDAKASGVQRDVKAMLTRDGVPFGSATWNARWSPAQFATAVSGILARGTAINIPTFATGSVLAGSTGTATGSEHMASFAYAYTIEGIRDWLFRQTA